jgi:phosphohistidine swiveling domain-containing protein
LLKEIKTTTAVWKKRLKKECTDKNIFNAYLEWKKQITHISLLYSMISWFAIEAWQIDFEHALNEMIQKNKKEQQEEEILMTAYAPWKKTAVHEIQEKVLKKVPVTSIVSKYQFLRSWSVVWYRPIDETWVKSIAPCEEIKIKMTKTKLFKLLQPNKKERKLLEIAPYIIFFKDWRDDIRRMHCYAWTFLFERISQQWNVPYDDIGYLTIDEIENALEKNNISIETIARRKNNRCVITEKESHITVFDENIPEKYQQIIAEIEKETITEGVKGLGAFKGKATGNVKIIRSYHDIKNIEQGDIFIANTTHPNYLPAMQKAAAFVTNEGGIISHAAIVAREMKKPCIVGTKVATKVFRDGDYVEVDAETGIIKKITKVI